MTRLLLFVALTVVVARRLQEVPDVIRTIRAGAIRARRPPSAGGREAGSGPSRQCARPSPATELMAALEQIRLFIDNASADGHMPTIETTFATLQRRGPEATPSM